ncbi:MAG: polysaccharide deacetylase family protein [Phycisphaerae bacterium]
MDKPEAVIRELEDSSGSAETRDARYASAERQGPHSLVVMYHYVHDPESGAAGTSGFTLRDEPRGLKPVAQTEPANPRRLKPAAQLEPADPRGLRPTAPGTHGLTSQEFCAQLDRLCNTAEPIDWPTLYAWMCGRRSVPDRCFLLTFDDGLADHAETVLPILEERGLRGAFFVPGAVLTTQRLLSAHAIHLLLSTLNEETLERELLDYFTHHGNTDTDRMASVDANLADAMYHYESPVRARLKYLLNMVLPTDLRMAAVDVIFERHIGSPARWAQHWYLSWDDLVRMESSGHTVGAHGHSHEPYSRLTPAQRREDMNHIADVLRNGLGPDIRPFSYPYGQFDDDTCTACCEAGFAHAFTTERHWVTQGGDVFRLPRVDTIDVEAMLEEEVACTRT